jgi:hypothetical protein
MTQEQLLTVLSYEINDMFGTASFAKFNPPLKVVYQTPQLKKN